MRLIHRADDVRPEDAPAAGEPDAVHARGWPTVAMSVITTADGTVAVDDRSGPLGCPTDSAVLRALRSAADWVLVGAATVRAEGYGAPSNPDLRIAVVSRTGAFSPDSTLFASGAGVVVVPDTAPPTALPEIRAGRPDDPSSVDLPEVITRLGGRRILVEGGPTLTGQLMAAELIDTVFVTWAPFAGRGGESLARFGASTGIAPIGFTLRWLYEDGDWLFARYDRIRAV